MFIQEELTAIAAAHKAVYEAIKGNFNGGDTGSEDMRAAKNAATQIVAAKIIANSVEK